MPEARPQMLQQQIARRRALRDDPTMETTGNDILTIDSGNRRQVLGSDSHTRISRGTYLLVPSEDAASKPWEARCRVAEARILALVRACSQTLVFTLYSALVLWGVDGWINNPDVTFRSEKRYLTSRLPDVLVGTVRVAGVRVRQTLTASWFPQTCRLGDIRVDSLENTALLFACTEHPLVAFVAVCGILRRLTRADKWALRQTPGLAEPIREKLLAALNGRPGTRGIRTARRILQFASAQCESVGERAFLWVLLTVSPVVPLLQHEVVVNGRQCFLDFAFPALRIAIEFDGMGKLGATEEEIYRNRREMVIRDQDLIRAGWRVFHFGWGDFVDFEALRARLVEMLGWHGVAVEPARASLWRPVPPSIGSRDRRA